VVIRPPFGLPSVSASPFNLRHPTRRPAYCTTAWPPSSFLDNSELRHAPAWTSPGPHISYPFRRRRLVYSLSTTIAPGVQPGSFHSRLFIMLGMVDPFLGLFHLFCLLDSDWHTGQLLLYCGPLIRAQPTSNLYSLSLPFVSTGLYF